MNNINENNYLNKSSVKKSKTFKEENSKRLNLTSRIINIGQNRLGTVLETINEVSNSKTDSSGLSAKSNNNNHKNIENNDEDNKDLNILEDNNSEHKKNY